MRMWMTEPEKMCRQHLLGEHNELHMLSGAIMKGWDISGWIRSNCVDFGNISSRHEILAAEMKRRGYRHMSPLDFRPPSEASEKFGSAKVDADSSREELRRRCAACAV